MSFLATIFSHPPFLYALDPMGWAGWLLYLGLIVVLLFNLREQNRPWTKTRQIIFTFLLLLVPLTSLFVSFQLDPSFSIPFPNRPEDPGGPVVMVLAAVPWILAGGLLGPASAALLAVISAVIMTLWGTHNVFTTLEIPLLAIFFAAVIGQRYRTPFYRLLRFPLFSALLLVLVFLILHLVSLVLSTPGLFVERVDFALASIPGFILAISIELVVAGLSAQVFAWTAPDLWFRPGPEQASPAERSLRTRFMTYLAPLAIVLVIVLMVFNWVIAGSAARAMTSETMQNTAEIVANNVTFFLDSGQQLLSRLAQNSQFQEASVDELQEIIRTYVQSVTYFSQISYLDAEGASISGYPIQNYEESYPPGSEQEGIEYTKKGVPFQSFSRPLDAESKGAQVSFSTPVLDYSGDVIGILIGRTNLDSNPYTKPLVENLTNFSKAGGRGILIDEEKRILFHQDPELLMSFYDGQTNPNPGIFEQAGADGKTQLVYSQPVPGRDWNVILFAPASRVQTLALRIAGPILGVIFILSALAMALLNVGVGKISASLKNLSSEATRIANGELDQELQIDGEDEVGDLRRNFEHMRTSLKARLDDLNRLWVVSQGIAASPDLDESLRPVLNAALACGAASARVVLIPAIIPELDDSPTFSVSFGAGDKSDTFKPLDDQVLAFNQRQDQLLLTNGNRIRLLKFSPGESRPEALLAFSLRHESLFYGSLWIAYDEPHKFTTEEIRFMIALSNQASLAAGNARLFLSAEVGRQRLAAIIDSSPDPVLVTDQNEQLLVANQAAAEVLGLDMINRKGLPVWRMISQPDLVKLLSSEASGKETIEVQLPDGRVFMATASSIRFDGEQNGRVCILRDVTRLKQLDTLKSEFVATVSHDLRQPLTMMRGYATMLEIVGQMNEQQEGYVRKIVNAVESMSRMVNNLLDLGRIEAGVGLKTEKTSLKQLFAEVVSSQQLQANQKHITVTTELSSSVPASIEVDPSLIQQAIGNLLENALKYTRPEGKVHLRAMKRRDRILIQVIDNGIGVSPLDQPRLFEKFYRGAQGVSKDTPGTGLGLAIVKSIAVRHGGQAWVESQLGKGSTFTLLIPIEQVKTEQPETQTQP